MTLSLATYRGRFATTPSRGINLVTENKRLASENKSLSAEVQSLVTEIEKLKQLRRRVASKICLADIVDAACRYYEVSPFIVMSRKILALETRARHVACLIAYEITDLSLHQIGRQLGGRDHTTVHHAVTRARQRRLADPDFAAEIIEITSWLEASQ